MEAMGCRVPQAGGILVGVVWENFTHQVQRRLMLTLEDSVELQGPCLHHSQSIGLLWSLEYLSNSLVLKF